MKGAACGVVRIGVSKPVSPQSILSTVSLLEHYNSRNKTFQPHSAQTSGKILEY